MTTFPRFYAVIPAAGAGRRMGNETPKQYLSVAGKTVLEHTLGKLLKLPTLSKRPKLQKLVVALSVDDPRWPNLTLASEPRIEAVTGGVERCDSVLQSLLALKQQCSADDWVLVHDVARPCISIEDIERLIATLEHHPVGGILAVPVSDTIKQVDKQGEHGAEICATVDRSTLWQAQTPQMFRYGILFEALKRAAEQQLVVTDEASAVEQMGYRPLVVAARHPNLKITRPDDLPLAEYYLQQEQLCE